MGVLGCHFAFQNDALFRYVGKSAYAIANTTDYVETQTYFFMSREIPGFI